MQKVVLVASVRLAKLVADLVHLLPTQRGVPYIDRLPEAHCERQLTVISVRKSSSVRHAPRPVVGAVRVHQAHSTLVPRFSLSSDSDRIQGMECDATCARGFPRRRLENPRRPVKVSTATQIRQLSAAEEVALPCIRSMRCECARSLAAGAKKPPHTRRAQPKKEGCGGGWLVAYV